MDPNQPSTPGQYDFILESSPKPSRFGSGGNSTKKRIFIVVAGALTLIVIATVVISLITSAGKQTFDDSIRLVALQNRMLQASSEAISTSPNADTRSLAATLNSSILSDNVRLERFLNSNGQQKLIKTLPTSDTTIKESLARAASNNDFDTTYNKIIDDLLAKYIAELKSSNENSKSVSEKAILEASFQNVSLLSAANSAE
ncbi:MAG: hypothetical protein M3Q70_01075 [bacterium]|nr:hypothetical protein [bacterium]